VTFVEAQPTSTAKRNESATGRLHGRIGVLLMWLTAHRETG
jgi:hypothetical protein